jgi:hypothetical protein
MGVGAPGGRALAGTRGEISTGRGEQAVEHESEKQLVAARAAVVAARAASTPATMGSARAGNLALFLARRTTLEAGEAAGNIPLPAGGALDATYRSWKLSAAIFQASASRTISRVLPVRRA